VVTRYWMRTPGSTGSDPANLLPKPPREVLLTRYAFPWAALDQQKFTKLLKGYLTWYVANSAPGSAQSRLNADFWGLHAGSSPVVLVNVFTDPTESDAGNLLAGFRSAVVDPVGAAPVVTERRLPWLQSTNANGYPDTGDVVGRRNKAKGTYLRRSYTDAQIATTYRYLTATSLQAPLAGVLMGGYGGRANSIDVNATATPQRDSVVKVLHTVHWDRPEDDARHLAWVREFYRDVHVTTGGVPELGGIADGSYINYADVDLADPQWNTSGVPWHALYYKHSYQRLQAVKARWDPRNVFRHTLSVRLPGT
jgi:aclacinomycin oxidase